LPPAPSTSSDELKERYISHWDWDWDCMSAQAYELLMTHARDARRERATKLRRGRLLRFGAAAAMLATVAAGAVIGLG